MQIKELYRTGKPVVSFEVFPPKKEADIQGIYQALEEMAGLSPDFVSVTYGAGGGGGRNKTGEIATLIQSSYSIPAMAHLTCVASRREDIQGLLDELRANGVENVLALRGDMPADREGAFSDYQFASDLIRDVRQRGDFCIGAACYPEGHIDLDGGDLGISHLRQKQEAGADFLVSQLFFDNDLFLRFLDKARNGGVTLPISAGVMPFLGRKQIERMIFMCGASLPSRIIKLLHKYESHPVDLRKAGIDYAAEQLFGLLEQGVDGVHIYTMNKSDIASHCMQRIGRR